MALYRDDAVVLRTYKLGEADRIIVLFTRNHGKVRAVAKGVRRTKSKFGARIEPGAIAHLQLYEGRNLDIITQAETMTVHTEIRRDLERFGRASMLLEVADQVSIEGQPNQAMFLVLTGALAELERAGNPLVVPAFVAKILVLEGVQPLLDACVTCGTSEDLIAIDLSEGGVLCRAHRRGEAISPDARRAFSLVFAGRVREVLDGTPPAVSAEVENLAARMIEQHIERRLRSSTVFAEHLQA